MKEIEVLYEDNHIIAVNKRSSQITQGDRTGDTPLNELVKEFMRVRDNKPGKVFLGTVHRLDRPVSGVVLFAKTSKALTRLNKMFQDKSIDKTYWAVTKQSDILPNDELTHFLLKNSTKNKTTAFDREKAGSKKSVLSYNLKGKKLNHNFIEVYPKTGRPHQIRVQLAKIGCVIKGDLKYGYTNPNENKSIHLHARKIEFLHPVKKEQVKIFASPPKDKYWNEFVKMENK